MKMYALLLFVLIALSGNSQNQPVKLVSVQDAQKLIATNPAIIIIDGRDSLMFSEGHLPTAVNIDAFSDSVEMELDTMDTSKHYLVYCTKHTRADALIESMSQKGFSHLYEMNEGITVWKQKEFKIETH